MPRAKATRVNKMHSVGSEESWPSVTAGSVCRLRAKNRLAWLGERRSGVGSRRPLESGSTWVLVPGYCGRIDTKVIETPTASRGTGPSPGAACVTFRNRTDSRQMVGGGCSQVGYETAWTHAPPQRFVLNDLRM